jgi:hypothetical protein
MRYPKKQDILGKTHEVEVREDLMEKKNAVGQYLWDEKILIQKGLEPELGKITYLHECFHGVIHRARVDAVLSREVEEILVDSLAVWLVENEDMVVKLLSQKK